MSLAPFTPQFLQESELQQYGLPTIAQQSDILNQVQFASAILDEECGRIDGDGNGSLVYTTYVQRVLLQTRNRNLFQIPMKPLVALDAPTIAALQGAASPSGNITYTGCLVNTLNQPNGMLSGIISASGRYGYTRQDQTMGYPDLLSVINPLNLVTVYGGPAPWVAIDVTNTDYDPKTGEVWIPAGLQLGRYSEVLMTYNSGWHPLQMPYHIKLITAALTKNLLAKGDGTTGLKNISMTKSGTNASFQEMVLDPTLDRMLAPFRNIRSY
jgi:hypothetical protein